MASSKAVFRWRWWGILLAVVAAGAVMAAVAARKDASAGEPSAGQARVIGPNTVVVRYRFLGEVATHYLDGVAAVTVYRRPEEIDAVVFNLETGKDYVVNADKLVDYALAPDTAIQTREELNKLYYHYDPYLQGEKQGWHKEWADAEFMKWAGRLPTDAEWLEMLNELTRRMEHPQMAHWIQYSPPAIRQFIETEFLAAYQRAPTDAEARQYYDRLQAGETYEQISTEIHAEAGR
jgi:hypothetical protein